VDTSKIDGRDVPVLPGPRASLRFTGGARGPQEAGDYEFWVAVRGDKGSVGRRLAGGDAGERFRRTEGLPEYAKHWELARHADFIRPARIAEVERWLDTHAEDARFALDGEVEGRPVRVAREQGRYLLKG
jgi:hypothetical protein